MRKLLALVMAIGILAASAVFAQVPSAVGNVPVRWSPAVTALSAVTTTGASSGYRTDGATSVMVQIFSASTSTSTITIEQSLDGSHWFVVQTITNVASTGGIYAGTSAYQTRVNVTARSGGTLSALVSWRTLAADPLATAWASIGG